MTLLPLQKKKTLSRLLHWPDALTGLMLGVASFVLGLLWVNAAENHGAGGKPQASENARLTAQAQALVQDDKMFHSVNTIAVAADKGVDAGMDKATAHAQRDRYAAIFASAATQMETSLAFARGISPNQRRELVKELGTMEAKLDFVNDAQGHDRYLAYSHAQAAVMDRPGFTATLDNARQVEAHAYDWAEMRNLGRVFSPVLAVLALSFGFAAVRRRFDGVIVKEEAAAAGQAETAAKADAEAREEAARQDREHTSNVTAAVKGGLDRDISVRKLRLSARSGANAGAST